MFCGIDEAGRGPVMGPLVVGAVYVEDDAPLRQIGVRDSKKLTPAARERMYDKIIEASAGHRLVVASAAEIDDRMTRMNLNQIEFEMFVEAASEMPISRVYADCPEPNEMNYSSALSLRLGNTVAVGRHKADDTFPVVSAASIIAKVTRDRLIADIAREFDADIGSGYPSDPYTMAFIEKWIRKNGVAPKHTRTSWEPVRRLMSVSTNTKIDEW